MTVKTFDYKSGTILLPLTAKEKDIHCAIYLVNRKLKEEMGTSPLIASGGSESESSLKWVTVSESCDFKCSEDKFRDTLNKVDYFMSGYFKGTYYI